MEYEPLWDLICLNFTAFRKELTRKAFDRLDSNNSKFVSINLLRELFYARNHVWVKEGRKTIEEVQKEFFDYIEKWCSLYGGSDLDAKAFL